MRTSILLLSANLTFLLASASLLPLPDIQQQQLPLQAKLAPTGPAIPGKSPGKYCSADYADDILELEYINLDPQSPKSGGNVTIEAKGTLKAKIEEGAYINVVVKLGYLTLLKQTFDFCEQVEQVDLECPLEKGERKIVKEVTLPDYIPNGKYNLVADAYTVDDERIVCLTADVVFK